MDAQLKRALAQALRVEILERIATAPASPRQLSEATGEPLGRIAYHASVLRRTGCIRPTDPGGTESNDSVYELATLLPAPPRLPLSDTTRGHLIGSVLRRIGEQGLAALRAGALARRATTVASCDSMPLDEEGWRDVQEILEEAAERIAGAKAAAAKRLAQSGQGGAPATVALAAFESAPGGGETA